MNKDELCLPINIKQPQKQQNSHNNHGNKLKYCILYYY